MIAVAAFFVLPPLVFCRGEIYFSYWIYLDIYGMILQGKEVMIEVQALKSCLSDLLLGLSFLFILSPAILYWFIHGSYERYIWLINGPYPFSHLGGGPFQIFLYAGLFISLKRARKCSYKRGHSTWC